MTRAPGDAPPADDAAGGAPLVAVVSPDPLLALGLVGLLRAEGVTALVDAPEGADVVLLDVAGEPPEALPARLAELAPAVVLLLTDDDAAAARGRAAGAGGVLARTVGGAELAAAARAAHLGLVVLSPAHAPGARPGPADAWDDAPLPEELTPREREVLGLLAEGMTNKAIARRLDVSESTVKFHLASLLAKFGARTRTELVVRAVQSGRLLL